MKRAFLALCATCVLAGATIAAAETMTFRHGVITTTQTQRHGSQIDKITCREFTELQQTVQPKVISYAIGYDKAKKPDAATFDVVEIDRLVPVIRKTCIASPETTLMERIRADLRKL